MKIIAVTQARTNSTRLPAKIFLQAGGQSILAIHIGRLRKSTVVNSIVVATTTRPEDLKVCEVASSLGVLSSRGSEDDVLDRYYQAVKPETPDYVVRVTSDCPLVDPALIDEVIARAVETKADYVSNVLQETFPDGQDVEVFTFKALERAWKEATLRSDREHVTPYIRRNADYNGGNIFKAVNVFSPRHYGNLRMTIDEPADFELISHLVEKLGTGKTWQEYAEYLVANKKVTDLNDHIQRNEGFAKSVKQEQQMNKRYQKSEEYLERALRTVPLGSQTFTKSKTQLPVGVSPFFATRGMGSHFWDVDGNEYIDFVNSLAAINLGYNDPDVNRAVAEQLQLGTIFSLATDHEFKVAEKIVEMVPCAEMVRFGKNGSDATAGAIRLARAYTKRDYVLVCGYHGWQDWYIGSTTRDLGVPKQVKELTHKFSYNDIGSLEAKFKELKNNVAAVILEPVNVVAPENNFLEKVKELTHQNGAVLVFDETITGFRYANGGAQEFFNVIPDLATFGKGLANGYPLSAVAGKAEIMRMMEEIFFSFTFGGETLSLVAAHAVLKKLQREPVVSKLFSTGQKIKDELDALIRKVELQDIFSVSGYPCWSFFTIKDTKQYTSWEMKTLLEQVMFENGIFMIGTHNMCYAHSDDDVKSLMKGYTLFFEAVRTAITHNNLKTLLRCEPLKPLFNVR